MVLEVLVAPIYETPVNLQRAALGGVFFAIAFPAFLALGAAQRCIIDAGAAASVLVEPLLALVTAGLAAALFMRMSALPVHLLACTVSLIGAYRLAGYPGGAIGAAAFGAFVYSRCMSFVCPFY